MEPCVTVRKSKDAMVGSCPTLLRACGGAYATVEIHVEESKGVATMLRCI